MRKGLIAGSFKPCTIGHWNLIQKASKECNSVIIFASTADRENISGEMMVIAWQKLYMQFLPSNVCIVFCKNPMTSLFDVLKIANENQSIDTFVLYADPYDADKNYDEAKLKKHFEHLISHQQIEKSVLPRTGENAYKAKNARIALKNNMKETFCMFLPKFVNHEQAWEIFSNGVMENTAYTKTNRKSYNE